ncbi:hypothetical protein [Ktedonospora formicarum]|uniref:hypothetical protein n=1 Tax=Ktedonospora formicarum TaxID=2778364 RepID=UPI001C6903CD|nr:hypothetical protein [Ktedonospora formicarum]
MHLEADLLQVAPALASDTHTPGKAAAAHALPSLLRTRLTAFSKHVPTTTPVSHASTRRLQTRVKRQLTQEALRAPISMHAAPPSTLESATDTIHTAHAHAPSARQSTPPLAGPSLAPTAAITASRYAPFRKERMSQICFTGS